MHGVVVVDEQFVPLRPAILWADVRSAAQAQRLQADMGTRLSRVGSPAVAGFAATTLAWLLENEPNVMARAAHVLQPKDWLRVALGGDLATDPSDASGTLLYDVADGVWSAEMLQWLGISDWLLPPVLTSNGAGGEIRIGAGAVPCSVGGADTACALAGLGLRTGEGFVAVGSGAQVVRVMARPELDDTLRTHTFAWRARSARAGTGSVPSRVPASPSPRRWPGSTPRSRRRAPRSLVGSGAATRSSCRTCRASAPRSWIPACGAPGSG